VTGLSSRCVKSQLQDKRSTNGANSSGDSPVIPSSGHHRSNLGPARRCVSLQVNTRHNLTANATPVPLLHSYPRSIQKKQFTMQLQKASAKSPSARLENTASNILFRSPLAGGNCMRVAHTAENQICWNRSTLTPAARVSRRWGCYATSPE
jgi:hypothetical protein